MATSHVVGVLRHLRETALLGEHAGLSDGQLLECFLAQRDEAAFETLVRRHGPMVLGVCRRVLGNLHDAEDAFQATFLVLVRKARAMRGRDVVGNWLHGVAYRTALRARGADALRRAKERDMPRPKAAAEDHWQELQTLLDRELDRLPEKYRVPIVLCDLEGKTRREAARQLGWPEGTVSGRLSRARALLARRLARQGLSLSSAAVAAALAQGAVRLPPVLLATTTQAAMTLATGQAAGIVSLKVVSLVEGVLKTMMLTKLKITTSVLVVVGLIGLAVGASGLATRAGCAPRFPQDPEEKPAVKKALAEVQVQLPNWPMPQQALVSLNKAGLLAVRRKFATYVPKTINIPGGARTSYELSEGRLRTDYFECPEVEVYDTKGKRIDPKALPRLLKEEVVALVYPSGQKVDPLHLRLIKEGTLVFVLPAPQVQGVPLIPPPTAPAAGPPLVIGTPPPQIRIGSGAGAEFRTQEYPIIPLAVDFGFPVPAWDKGRTRALVKQGQANADQAVLLVNSKRITLHYNTKVSDARDGDTAAELWSFQDGRGWKKYGETNNLKQPFVLDVAGEGRYGFTLVVRNGEKLSRERPRDGDLPQVWVEVDLTPPKVHLTAVEMDSDNGQVTITWKASDKNLSPQPISLFYASEKGGPWTLFAKDLEDSGRYLWQGSPELPARVYLRVQAIDQAGNVAVAETPKAIAVGVSRPEGTIIGVEPATPR